VCAGTRHLSDHSIDAWNISTLRWLRRVAYERLHLRLRTGATYFLSAYWHGFFPGYYVMFATTALCTSAARRVHTADNAALSSFV
jgi:hypothetical protein